MLFRNAKCQQYENADLWEFNSNGLWKSEIDEKLDVW